MGVLFDALASCRDHADGAGGCFFSASPEGDVFVDDVDVVPVVEGLCAGVVEFVVEDCSAPVFHCVFEACYDEDYDYRNGSEAGIRCAENGEYLASQYHRHGGSLDGMGRGLRPVVLQ
jgi:hypothetical protein